MLQTLEKIVLDPLSESPANAPLEVTGRTAGHGIYLVEHSYPAPAPASTLVGSVDTEGQLRPGEPHLDDREIPLTLYATEESGIGAATNLITNPQAGQNTAGATNVGLLPFERVLLNRGGAPMYPLEAQAETAYHGIGDAVSDCMSFALNVTNGVTYRISLYVYLASLSATSLDLRVQNATSATVVTKPYTTLGAWNRIDVQFTANATAVWTVQLTQVGAGGCEFYATSWLATTGAPLTEFFCGDTPGCRWSGARHASTSLRKAAGGKRFSAAMYDLEEKLAKLMREGGTYKRVLPAGDEYILDIVQGEGLGQWARAFNQAQQEVQATLLARPFSRGIEYQSGDHVETNLPFNVFVENNIPGDVSALGRWVADEDQGFDQFWLATALQSRYYDPAANAALFYEAEALTLLGTATLAAGGASASGAGNNVVRATLGSNYTGILSTQLNGGAHLQNVGSYRILARIFRATANSGAVDVAMEWGWGDMKQTTINAATSYPALPGISGGYWQIIDLGPVRIPQAILGTQKWEGRIIGRSTFPGDTIDIDCLALMPTDEFYGELKPGISYQIPTTALAQEGFNQSAGNLAGATVAMTAVTAANPGVITSAAHGLANGDKVWLTSINGTMNTVLTGYFTVAGVTANTFDVGVNTTGLTYISGGTIAKAGKAVGGGTGAWHQMVIGLTDFVVDASAHNITRSANGQPGVWLAPGVGKQAGVVVQMDYTHKACAGYFELRARAQDTAAGASEGVTLLIQRSTYGAVAAIQLNCFYGNIALQRPLSTKFGVGFGGSVSLVSGSTYTVRLMILANGQWAYWIFPAGGPPGDPMDSGQDPLIATGGALATGYVGWGENGDLSIVTTRVLDNFLVFVPSQRTAVNASHSTEVRWDQVLRQDASGALWSPMNAWEGDLLRIPCSGREDRPVRFISKMSRGPQGQVDGGIDDRSDRLWITPRFLNLPDPS